MYMRLECFIRVEMQSILTSNCLHVAHAVTMTRLMQQQNYIFVFSIVDDASLLIAAISKILCSPITRSLI